MISAPPNSVPPCLCGESVSAQRFLVRVSRQAMHFHKERFGPGKVFSAAPDHEASTFLTEEDADYIAREHGLNHGQFTIEPFTPQPE